MTSSSADSPLTIVQNMYEAFGRSDEQRLRELIDADVEWRQCEGFPGGEHRRGIDSVLAGVLRGNKATWQGFRVKIDRYVATDEDVVALGSYSGTHSETGRTMHSVFAHAYRVANGKIVGFEQFADTWPMVRAMANGD